MNWRAREVCTWTTLKAGVALAAVMAATSVAIDLPKRPSDKAVAAGYLILLAVVAAVVGAADYFRRQRRGKR